MSTETERNNNPKVAIVMGSQSDWDTMRLCAEQLTAFSVPFETRVVSAHRTPHLLVSFASEAAERGIEVIVAGAGGAAHLPGMIAALSPLPVVGVPVESRTLRGLDSLLSIVQMPGGVPVATVAIGNAGAVNAAILAANMLGIKYPEIRAAVEQFRANQTTNIEELPPPSLD